VIPPPFLPGLYYINGVGVAVAITQLPPTPPATITGPATASDPINLFVSQTGGYVLTVGGVTAGTPVRYWNVRGGTSNLAVDPVKLDRGANTFLIEDPQNVLAAPAIQVNLSIPGGRYEFVLDATNKIFRCMRQVQ
jgi:hypothetical protein